MQIEQWIDPSQPSHALFDDYVMAQVRIRAGIVVAQSSLPELPLSWAALMNAMTNPNSEETDNG